MGTKLMWTGLVIILAANPVLGILGLNGGGVIEAVGAIIMIIGCFVMWAKE